MELLAYFLTGAGASAVLTSLIAPRINALLDHSYQEKKVLNKTLHILLEIECYVQRKLKHPAMGIISDVLIEKVIEADPANEEQIRSMRVSAPRAMQQFQTLMVQAIEEPDKEERLQRAFDSILDELSTVEPLLAYRISERHKVNPIQQLNTLPFDVLKTAGISISEEEVRQLTPMVEKHKSETIEDTLNDLRKDITTIAGKVGRKRLKEINAYYEEIDANRNKVAREKMIAMLDAVPKKADIRGTKLAPQT